MRSTPQRTIDANTVEVWLAFPEAITDPQLLAAYGRLLTDSERKKCGRFRFAEGQHECLVSRALVRTVLSRYAPVPPSAWRFECNTHGRPDLTPGQCPLPIRFNLSHTTGLIACAVTLTNAIGVDVEDQRRKGETVSIADRYFSAAEVASLKTLPPEQQRARFFRFWTLKESYIKARGLGLSLPLDQFSFDLDHPTHIRISFAPQLGDDPGQWQFALRDPTPHHVLAVAVGQGPPRALQPRIFRTTPLAD